MVGKLDGYNYDCWYRNIIYMCDEQDVTYTLDTEMDIPFVDGVHAPMPAQHVYEKWVKDNCMQEI